MSRFAYQGKVNGKNTLDDVRRAMQAINPDRPDNEAFSYIVYRTGLINIVYAGGCHALARLEDEQPIIVAGGLRIPKKFFKIDNDIEDIYREFCNWVCDPKESPWKSLLVNGIELTTYKNKGEPTGWVIHGNHLCKVNPLFIKNFLVLTRSFSESVRKWDTWFTLIHKYGLSREEAVLFITRVDKDLENKCTKSKWTNLGSHWAFTDASVKDWEAYGTDLNSVSLSLKALRDKTPNLRSVGNRCCKVNAFWLRDKPVKRFFDLDNYPPSIDISARFAGNIQSYTFDDTVKHFKQWLEEYGKE